MTQPEMQVAGQVTEIAQKTGSGGPFYRFQLAEVNGSRRWYTWFDSGEDGAKILAGRQYLFRYIEKPNPRNEANPYRNITGLLEELDGATAPPPERPAPGGAREDFPRPQQQQQQYLLPQHPDVRRSIERQSCLKAAVEAMRNEVPLEEGYADMIIETADDFYNWVSGSAAAPQGEETDGEVAEAESVAEMPKFPEGVGPEVVIDTAHFGAKCRDAGLGLRDVQRLLGNQEDNPLDAWQEQHRGTIAQAWNHLVEAVEAESAGPPRRDQAEDVIRI